MGSMGKWQHGFPARVGLELVSFFDRVFQGFFWQREATTVSGQGLGLNRDVRASRWWPWTGLG